MSRRTCWTNIPTHSFLWHNISKEQLKSVTKYMAKSKKTKQAILDRASEFWYLFLRIFWPLLRKIYEWRWWTLKLHCLHCLHSILRFFSFSNFLISSYIISQPTLYLWQIKLTETQQIAKTCNWLSTKFSLVFFVVNINSNFWKQFSFC